MQMENTEENTLIRARKNLEDFSRRLQEMRRHAPGALVAQLQQGLTPDPQELKLLSDYLETLEAFETHTEQVVGIASARVGR